MKQQGNNTDGKSLKVYIEQVKGSSLLWSTVAVEYDINDGAACKRCPNVLREFARIGFTPEANYKPNKQGITKIVLSKLGHAEHRYFTWTQAEARENLAALERAFKRLNYPWTVKPVTEAVVSENEEADEIEGQPE